MTISAPDREAKWIADNLWLWLPADPGTIAEADAIKAYRSLRSLRGVGRVISFRIAPAKSPERIASDKAVGRAIGLRRGC